MKRLTLAGIAFAGVLAVVAIAAVSGQPSTVKVNGNVGEIATVEGVVSEVYVAPRSGVTFIDMGGRYPNNTFVAVIWPENASTFPNVATLYGQAVKITGPLTLYEGKPEIILRIADQIKNE